MADLSSLFEGLEGRVQEDYALGKNSWFAAGGNTAFLYSPKDEQELAEFLKRADTISAEVHIIGRLSNCLIRDGGIPGVCVRLGRAFTEVTFTDNMIISGAAVLDRNLAALADEKGLSGIEFLSGIPGSLGGAIAMNAGCYGGEVKDVLAWIEVALPSGKIQRLDRKDIKMSYRHTELPAGCVVTKVAFNVTKTDNKNERERIQSLRENSQPIKSKTGGSTFRNPEGHSAWKLVDEVGFRGKRRGGAQFSEKHCNFLINTGDATASDIEQLGEDARTAVRAKFGIDLHWEIKRLGDVK